MQSSRFKMWKRLGITTQAVESTETLGWISQKGVYLWGAEV